jgi:hypothetical protein
MPDMRVVEFGELVHSGVGISEAIQS